MSNNHVFVTGGAGFIGQRVLRSLLASGSSVTMLDNFSPQIHGDVELPKDLENAVRVIRADIRDRDAVRTGLIGASAVIHLAAETGTGQSMYEIENYFGVNVQGTAVLLDLLQNDSSGKDIGSIVLASSRATYGEGAYSCLSHGVVYPQQRYRVHMSAGQFEPLCPFCGVSLTLVPTSENAPLSPMSVYGLTKQVQEQAVLMFARTRGINGFGLRYQNVYGPGQSLKNPYTGILAVFSNLARQNQLIEIYEDGKESRDFVYINDVVEATVKCVDYSAKFVGALNVGLGQAVDVLTVANEIKSYFNSNSEIRITGAFRLGDIRHNVADTAKLKETLGFSPSVPFRAGLNHFLNWASNERPENKDAYLRSVAELSSRGLMGKALTQ
jgi:dTDP-L-rhamnose 4-epimerase